MRGCGGCWMRREQHHDALHDRRPAGLQGERGVGLGQATPRDVPGVPGRARGTVDRKSTRLNSSHQIISYAVFCLKKKKKKKKKITLKKKIRKKSINIE